LLIIAHVDIDISSESKNKNLAVYASFFYAIHLDPQIGKKIFINN